MDSAATPVVAAETALENALGLVDSPDPALKPLPPWQSAFAEWLSSQPDKPSTQAQRKMASALLRQTISPKALRRVIRNPAFIRYLALLNADALRRSRAILEQHYTEGVHAHLSGMRSALDANDYKALPSFTVPILDRVVPKKEQVAAATQVNVVLSTKQQALIAGDAPEVTYEVLPPDALQP